jgi:hypothetical protein
MRSAGCPQCSKENKKQPWSYWQEIYTDVHGDKFKYYPEKYVNSKTAMPIDCPVHGEFMQTPSNHKIHGCQQCSHENRGISKRLDFRDFREKCEKINPGKFEFIDTNYQGYNYQIGMKCKRCDQPFQALVKNLLDSSGYGCPHCKNTVIGEKNSLSSEEFFSGSRKIHNNFYLYEDDSVFNGLYNPFTFTCPLHGKKTTNKAINHYVGCGCTSCNRNVSEWEKQVTQYINDLGFDTSRSKSILSGKRELDIYIEKKSIAIECNGLYYHSQVAGDKPYSYHIGKTRECDDKNIQLIHLMEDEWKFKQDIIKSMLASKLGVIQNKIFARKCDVREVSLSDTVIFLEKNHIQGRTNSTTKLGLYYKDELVSLMTFIRNADGDELNRYCNKLHTMVIGGASKLLKYYIDKFDPAEIVSYADRRFSVGKMYTAIGFTQVEQKDKPNYYYLTSKDAYTKRHDKKGFRREFLPSKLSDFDPNKGEWENMKANGWDRIWDCGLFKFRWTKP